MHYFIQNWAISYSVRPLCMKCETKSREIIKPFSPIEHNFDYDFLHLCISAQLYMN